MAPLNMGYLLCVDEDLNTVWSHTFEGAMHGGIYKLVTAPGGDIILCGWQRTAGDQSAANVQRLSDRFIEPDFEATPGTGHAPLQGVLRSTSISNPPLEEVAWDTDGDGVYETTADSVTYSYGEPGYHTIGLRVNNGGEPQELVRTDYIRVFDGNSCLGFDGASALAYCEPSAMLHQQDAITVEAWICPHDWGETTLTGGRIADKNSWAFFICRQNNALGDSCLAVYLRTEDSPQCYGTTPTGSISLHAWQHVAFTYSVSDGAAAFINGQVAPIDWAVSPSGALIDHSNAPLFVGAGAYGASAFEGLIDEVRVWNYVRSQQQIVDGMGGPVSNSDAELVACWRLDEGCGDNSTGSSLWQHELALSGATWWQGAPYVPTSVDEPDSHVAPANLDIMAMPNPFNPETRLVFSLPAAAAVCLELYNIRGQQVRVLLRRDLGPGRHEVLWDGMDSNAAPCAGGVYLARLRAGKRECAAKLLLLK